MAPPKGNTYWKFRSPRSKLFKKPEDLLNAAQEYFEWCDKNPWIKVDYKGKNIERVEIPTQRPYTIKGLCLHLGVAESFWRAFRNSENLSENMKLAIEMIDMKIYTNKFEGAIVGTYNGNIISRDLGLIDKREVDNNGTVKFVFDSDDEQLGSENPQ